MTPRFTHPAPRLLAALLTLTLVLALPATAAPTISITPTAPTVNASGYLLMDYDSGRMLVEKNIDDRLEPASLTKMMSTYVVAQELKGDDLKLDDMVNISKKAWRAEGSRMFVEVDTQVSVEDLLKGVIVQSGNDATIALAEHVAGSEDSFASLMNEYAARLGMTGTSFVNSTGLPHPDHYTTPRDLATLARALIRDDPHYDWYAIREFTWNKITQPNRNRLLWRDKSVDGIKTGHTKAAGYCLVASAKREGMRLISVVLGTSSENAREQASQSLLNYGFRFFETRRLHGAGESLVDARIWKGEAETLPLGLDRDLYVTIQRGKFKKLATSLSYDEVIVAPATAGQGYGTLTVTVGDDTVAERPLLALQDVPDGSLWQWLVDTIKLFFWKLLN